MIFLLDVYGKHEAEDLSMADKQRLQIQAKDLVKDLRRRF